MSKSKKLVTAALAGLLGVATLSACTTDHANDKSSCKTGNSCKGKTSVEKSTCKAKERSGCHTSSN